MIKTLKNFLASHKYFLLLIILFITMLPLTISMPAQTDTRAIVTGISIDKKEDKYTLGLQLVSPQSNISNNENLQVVEDEGDSFYDCIANLSIKLGKIIGLEHASIIILGEQMINEDIMNILDYLYRNYKITMSAILIQCKGEAKKLLETSAELNNNSSSSLQNNLGFNNNIIETANTTTLGTFFNDYYSFAQTSLLSVIETPNNEQSNQGSGSQSSQQGEQDSSSQQSSSQSSSQSAVEPLIINNGEGAIFKNGKLVEIISKDLTKGFTWPQEKTIQGIVKLDDVTDNKFYNHSAVNIKVEQSKTKIDSVIKNNQLSMNVDLKLYCYVAEIVDNNKKTTKTIELNENYLTEELNNKIKEKITELVNRSLQYSKENKIDVFQFYDRFYKHNNKEFRKVLNDLGENYLNNCTIKLNITVYPFK